MAKTKNKVVPVREFLKFKPLELLQGLKTNLDVLFEDNVVKPMTYKEIIIQRYLLDFVVNLPVKVPINSNQCITNFYSNGYFTSKVIGNFFSTVLETLAIIQEASNIFSRESILKHTNTIYYTGYKILNDIYNELVYDKLEYSGTVDITDYMEVQFKEDIVKAIQHVQQEQTPASVTHAYDVVENTIRNDLSIKDNNFVKAYQSGSINRNQAMQIIGPRGFITDLDNTIYKKPVSSSFILGMNSIYEMAIESRAAALALYLSTTAVTKSEYLARETQLVTMVVESLVDGDCGSKDYLEWLVRPKDVTGNVSDIDNLLGKYYLNEETGLEEPITKNHKHLEGKTIKLRSAINCKLPNPKHICLKCFGRIGYAIPYHSNLGHYCSTAVSKEITQAILSTKHLTTSASSTTIKLDPSVVDYVHVKKNLYYLNPDISTTYSKVLLTVSQGELFGIKDINSNTNIANIILSNISRIDKIAILLYKTENDTPTVVNLTVKQSKRLGMFTHALLQYIIKYKYTIDKDGKYVIDISKFNYKQPIITIPEAQDSMLDLSDKYKSVLKSKQSTYKSAKVTPELLLDTVFNILNQKLSVNLALLEVIVYAFTIVSSEDNNYNLARNSLSREVAILKDVIVNRSLGAGYAWERLTRIIILSTRSYAGNNAIEHPMDVILKPQEVLTNTYNS